MIAAKEDKLDTFLKEQNIEATVEEVKAYLTKKFENKDELSKEELDMAAGGMKDSAKVAISIFTLFIACGVSQAQHSSECFLNK